MVRTKETQYENLHSAIKNYYLLESNISGEGSVQKLRTGRKGKGLGFFSRVLSGEERGGLSVANRSGSKGGGKSEEGSGGKDELHDGLLLLLVRVLMVVFRFRICEVMVVDQSPRLCCSTNAFELVALYTSFC